MEIKNILLDLLQNQFYNNKQKFLVSLINSKEFFQLRESIIKQTSFLIKPSWSQRIYHVLTNLIDIPKCYCSNITKFFDLSKGYNKYCSSECKCKSIEVRKKREKTNLKRFGTKTPGENQDIKNKVKQTNLKKYGFESHNQSEEIKEKKKQVYLERFGVENPSLSEEIKQKRKNTFLERFGVENPNMDVGIKEKKKQYFLKKYGVKWITQDKNIREKQKNTFRKKYFNSVLNNKEIQKKVKFLFSVNDYVNSYSEYPFLCLNCGQEFFDSFSNWKIPRCLNCYPIYKGISIKEKKLLTWLKNELGIQNILENSRQIISPFGLDIYISEKNLAIEFNGLYWHSELGNEKIEKYHLNKTEKCNEKGIQLIHIFEDEWLNKQEIVKSIIKHKLGLNNKIYARNTEFKEISNQQGLLFFEINHLQGWNNQIKYSFGLFYNQELIFAIGLGSSRYTDKYDYELIRSCSKLNTVVTGGFEKLIKNLPLHGKFISYVDRRYFNGLGYKNWNFVGITKPNYFYFKDNKNRQSRLKYQKHKLLKLFPDIYNINLTEWEIMQLAGYDRIWDCGNLVYSRILP